VLRYFSDEMILENIYILWQHFELCNI